VKYRGRVCIKYSVGIRQLRGRIRKRITADALSFGFTMIGGGMALPHTINGWSFYAFYGVLSCDWSASFFSPQGRPSLFACTCLLEAHDPF